MARKETSTVASSGTTSYLVAGIGTNGGVTPRDFMTDTFGRYENVTVFECDKEDLDKLGKDLKYTRESFIVIINDGDLWNLDSTLRKNPSIDSSQYQYFLVKA